MCEEIAEIAEKFVVDEEKFLRKTEWKNIYNDDFEWEDDEEQIKQYNSKESNKSKLTLRQQSKALS